MLLYVCSQKNSIIARGMNFDLNSSFSWPKGVAAVCFTFVYSKICFQLKAAVVANVIMQEMSCEISIPPVYGLQFVLNCIIFSSRLMLCHELS